MSNLSNFATVALAIFALLAGWINCIRDQPNYSSWIYRIPLLGSTLSRIKPLGWFMATSILLATLTTLYSSGIEKQASDLRLENLKTNTEKIDTATQKLIDATSHLSDRLNTSIANLESNSTAVAQVISGQNDEKFAATPIRYYKKTTRKTTRTYTIF